MQTKPSLKQRPHTIYTLADPRTRAIRYVGRTVRDPTSYFMKRLREAREDSRQPVDRWICRLRRQGLEPIHQIRGRDVRYDREWYLCELLVKRGARLLNMLPAEPRARGKILVDVERCAEGYAAEVVHLLVSVKTKGRYEAYRKAAAAAFRRLADLVEVGGPQYELGTLLAVVEGLFEWCEEGKVEKGPTGALWLMAALDDALRARRAVSRRRRQRT